MDSFIENIELKRKVIVDYEFMSFLIEKANNDDTNAITFIDYISNPEVDVYDFLGNKFDIRALQFMQDVNKDNEIIKKETVEPDLSKANCFTILAFNDDIEANLLVLTNKDFKTKWEILSKCKSISINKGERFNSITDFWNKTLENYINIPCEFLIIQEPFLFNKIIPKNQEHDIDNKAENIEKMLKIMNKKEYLIICRNIKNRAGKNEFRKNKTIEEIKTNYAISDDNLLDYKEEAGSHRIIHDRFFLTNYFYFRSGNSFDYFNSNDNKVQLSTSLIATSIVNDFSSFLNFKKYYKNIK